jgi:Ca-activated chloride channel family protein
MTAIRAALAPSGAPGHVRVVCFATDGYVGNDLEILDEVRRHPSARVFALGIGEAPNRFLLDGMAEAGRGEVGYVSLSEDGSAAARRFERRVRSPLLTDVSIEWGALDVVDLHPSRIPDVFDARPVVVCGRYRTPGRGTIRLRGTWGGRAFEREVEVELPERETRHDALAKLWARARVDALARQDYEGQQRGEVREDLREAITRLGLDYGLLTDYTSFVAVEERPSVDGGRPVLVEVPVELPRGMSQCGSVTEDFSLWGMSQRMDWSTRLYYLLMVAAVVYGAWLIVRAMRGQSKKGHG